MNNNFQKSISFTLPWEVGRDKSGKLREDGGLTNDPNDPGGATKWGISQRANPKVNVPLLTLQQALEIYKEKYWDVYKNIYTDPIDLDTADLPFAVAVFDTGVNCGVRRAYGWSMTAMKDKEPVKTLLALREQHYIHLVDVNPTQKKYFKGWINRLNDLKKYCEILATS